MSFPQQVRAVSYFQPTHSQIIPFPKPRNASGPIEQTEAILLPYADYRYLLHVIAHLKQVRKSQKLTIQELARRSEIPKSVISRAESKGEVPKTQNFKAWAAGLGLSWEDVWRDSLPQTEH